MKTRKLNFRLLVPAQNSGGKEDDRPDEAQHAVDRDADESEREEKKPHNGIQNDSE